MVVAIERYKIAYMPVPKAACSAVKEGLARIDPDIDIPPQPDADTFHILYPTRRFRPHRWAEYNSYWRFCVLRDPLRRLLSVYTNRVVQMQELRNSPRLRHDPAFADLPVDPDPDVFFQNLARYRAAASSIKHHAFPCWLFTGPDLGRFNRVYRTEEIEALAAELGQRIGRPVAFARRNVSARPLSLDALAPQTRSALRSALAAEYDYLSEFYENPFGKECISLAR